MAEAPDFDVEAAHRYFAAYCFNRAWDLIDKQERTVDENRLMLLLNQASLYHWSQRPDNDDRRMSVGNWQASRIQSLLGNVPEAKRYAEICLEHSRELEPFYLGYAYEALARAARLAGADAQSMEYLAEAEQLARSVARKEDREMLEKDLAGLRQVESGTRTHRESR